MLTVRVRNTVAVSTRLITASVKALIFVLKCILQAVATACVPITVTVNAYQDTSTRYFIEHSRSLECECKIGQLQSRSLNLQFAPRRRSRIGSRGVGVIVEEWE